MRVPEFLAEQQIAFETLWHPPAYTAQKRAKYLHVSGHEVAKSVLLLGPDGYLVVILPATHQVDTEALAQVLHGPVRVASDREVAEVFPDCEYGVVPPFGSLYGLPTFLEEEMPPESGVVFEGPRRAQAIRLCCRDFEELEHPRRLHFARRP